MDNWSPFGNLSKFLSPVHYNAMGIHLAATLSDIYENGAWNVRPARSDNQVSVQAHLATISLSDLEDESYWIVDDIEWRKYNTWAVYNLIKYHQPLVPWSDVVWLRGGIPRHSFLTWLVALNRIPTRDRLISWGLQVSPSCLLCAQTNESRDHLLFDCSFSWDLWRHLASRVGLIPSCDWNTTLAEMQSLPGPLWRRRLCLLVWQMAIYTVWSERNSRLHRQTFRNFSSLSKQIDRDIRNKIQSLREVNPTRCSQMMQYWLSSSATVWSDLMSRLPFKIVWFLVFSSIIILVLIILGFVVAWCAFVTYGLGPLTLRLWLSLFSLYSHAF